MLTYQVFGCNICVAWTSLSCHCFSHVWTRPNYVKGVTFNPCNFCACGKWCFLKTAKTPLYIFTNINVVFFWNRNLQFQFHQCYTSNQHLNHPVHSARTSILPKPPLPLPEYIGKCQQQRRGCGRLYHGSRLSHVPRRLCSVATICLHVTQCAALSLSPCISRSLSLFLSAHLLPFSHPPIP